MTLHQPDPLPVGETPDCYRCESPAIGLIDNHPVCAEHQSEPCSKCGRLYLIGAWPSCKGRPEDHGPVPTSFAQGFDPVVVHFDPKTGEYRFPGAADARTPQGYERQELRTMYEIRKFQHNWNASERRKADLHVSREQHHIAQMDAANRPELRARMNHMSEFGKEFARIAMDRSNAQRPKTHDPGCHLDAFENDRSNREPHNDQRTGWRGRY